MKTENARSISGMVVLCEKSCQEWGNKIISGSDN